MGDKIEKNVKPIIQIEHSDWVYPVIFTPDGKILISGSNAEIKFWDVKTRKLIKTIEEDFTWLHHIALSPNGKTLVSGSESIKFWNVKTSKLIETIKGDFDWATFLAFSPNGNYLAVVTQTKKKLDGEGVEYSDLIEMWAIKEKIRIWSIKGDIYLHLVFSPDGKILACGYEDGTIKFLNASNGKIIRNLKGHSNWVRCLAFSPDGEIFASGGRDKTVTLWDVKTGELINKIEEIDKEFFSLVFSPDGKTLVAASEGDIIFWHVKRGEIIRRLQSPLSRKGKSGASRIISLAFSPDGNTLVSSGIGIEFWNLKD